LFFSHSKLHPFFAENFKTHGGPCLPIDTHAHKTSGLEVTIAHAWNEAPDGLTDGGKAVIKCHPKVNVFLSSKQLRYLVVFSVLSIGIYL